MKNQPLALASKPTILYILLLCLVFPIVFFQLFSAGFVSWDDAEYVLENKDVHTCNIYSFFTKFYVGNYHPLTMLNYALDWKLFGREALGYHIENLCWHLLNSCLVFIISKKFLNQTLNAFLVTLIFSFHPLQVESVAWIAERKNVLYAFFFLLGIINYLKFLDSRKIKYIVFTFILFCLSLLSKPSAIIFPVVLFLVEAFVYKKISKSFFLNKIPFVLASIVMVFLTIKAQAAANFLNENHAFAVHERIGYAGYAIFNYLYHFFAPLQLSVIYPYPQNHTSSVIAGYFAIAIIIFCLYKLYKLKKDSLLFGMLFFIVNLLLVLQLVPFGETLTADRYMYLPIIGVAFIFISILSLKEKQAKIMSITLLIIFGSFTFVRSHVWKNSITLYSDILKKYPHSYVALSSLGAEYMLDNNYQLARKYLNSAINENRTYYKAYYNRGLLEAQTNNMQDAISDFSIAIRLKDYTKAYVARANAYYIIKDFPKTISDAGTAIKAEPFNTKANYVLANCYDDLNQLDKALFYYDKVILVNAENPLFYLRRAIVYGKMKNYNLCLKDLNQCTSLDITYAEAYYWKGVVKVNLKQNPCNDLQKALTLGFEAAKRPLANYCK